MSVDRSAFREEIAASLSQHAIWTRLFLAFGGIQTRPALVFSILSVAFGLTISVVVPPLRGPDEIAHFLRIDAYTRGELLPASELDGRKGTLVDSELYRELTFFKNAGEYFARNRERGVRYTEIMQAYAHRGSDLDAQEQASKFLPFAGTEGYSPVSYAPYIVARCLAKLLDLDFPDTLLLMRIFGVIVLTAIAAYAINVTPALKWAFVLIALLPVSLYNRSVLSADGAALSYALMVTALCFSAIQRLRPVWERSLWMTLCALSKQPQIIFILLELMVRPRTDRKWGKRLALVVLPGLILSPLWVVGVSADVAAWRLLEAELHPREHFDPIWKLAYMWEHPFHFPLAMWTAISVWGDRLWQELIGVLGWQDIVLQPWIYLVLTLMLPLVCLQKLHLSDALRTRVAVVSALTFIGYIVLVYLIFFITYTPIDIDHVRGVQGRYFVIALPLAAVFLAAIANFDLPRGVLAIAAIFGSSLSGIATVQALFQAHWSVP